MHLQKQEPVWLNVGLAEKVSLPAYREALKAVKQQLEEAFFAERDIDEIVFGYAHVIDRFITTIWQHYFPEHDDIALVAVGGYGRGELHPASDIDLLILLRESDEPYRDAIQQFLMFLWDIGLEVGHSTRSLSECVINAREDITVATNLMEARLLYGNESLYQTMREQTGPDVVWPSKAFFEAKWQEQINRYHKYHDTGYNLEPNVKEGPGGLRDIQMIGWVAKRHFGVEHLHQLVEHHFLTEKEFDELLQGQRFLWRVRCGLHVLSGRREDRLLFDHQRKLAQHFGYEDDKKRLAVEKFMKEYYRTIMGLDRLNELLLQLYQEEILLANIPPQITAIDEHFQNHNGFLEFVPGFDIRQRPQSLLEIFLIMSKHPQLKGIRANTIRLLREHRYLIDDTFRANDEAKAIFIALFRQGTGLTHELRRMSRHGILAAYLPVFSKIVGQMQHDLFHVYTVDEHTLFVIRNLRRLTVTEFHHEYPLASTVILKHPKPELLYLAAMFHDIAKGRGGDHSALGAVDAEEFCHQHHLTEEDTHLVTWLVKSHLIMSTTAQRQDISDPDVITRFAQLVKEPLYLDSLYLLTMSDIRATSPNVWNSWKDALLANLYRSTSELFSRGIDNPLSEAEKISRMQAQALDEAAPYQLSAQQLSALWSRLEDDYFLHYSPDEYLWHAQSILLATEKPPIIRVRQQTQRGGTEVFIYTPLQRAHLTQTANALERLGLNIVGAQLINSKDNYSLNTFIVLENSGKAIDNPMRIQELLAALQEALPQSEQMPPPYKAPLPRQLKHFPVRSEISFSQDPFHQHTQMELRTADRPGLLAQLARIALEEGIVIKSARITTLGERVEDVFVITDEKGDPINDEVVLEGIKERIVSILDNRIDEQIEAIRF